MKIGPFNATACRLHSTNHDLALFGFSPRPLLLLTQCRFLSASGIRRALCVRRLAEH